MSMHIIGITKNDRDFSAMIDPCDNFLDCGNGLYGADGYYNESDADPDCGHWSGNALIIFNDNIECVDAVALDVPHPCTKAEYDRIIAEAAQRYKEHKTAVRV